jgi:cytochrome P450
VTDAVVSRRFPFPTERLELDPVYVHLREHEPISKVEMPYGGWTWLATHYQDVRAVLADARFSRGATLGTDAPRLTRDELSRGPTLMTTDPPVHTRLRQLANKALTVRRVERLRPAVAKLVTELFDDMLAAGPPVDLIEALAVPLPMTIICQMLGVPIADQGRFRGWIDSMMSTTQPADHVAEQARQLTQYLADLVVRRRAEPADDLTSALVEARDTEGRLSEPELVNLLRSLIIAGQETTVNEIGNIAYVLLTQPDLYARLRAEPELVPGAVEELLRYIPLGIGDGFVRIATEDVELGGVLVRKGESVMVSLPSANRDCAVFADADRVDLARKDNAHVTFGYGPHFCPGAPLARIELQAAVKALVSRLPGFAFAGPPEDLRWKGGMRMRGLVALPVTWGDGTVEERNR